MTNQDKVFLFGKTKSEPLPEAIQHLLTVIKATTTKIGLFESYERLHERYGSTLCHSVSVKSGDYVAMKISALRQKTVLRTFDLVQTLGFFGASKVNLRNAP